MKTKKQININWQIIGVLAAIIVIIVVTGIIRPQFFKLSNIANVVRQNAALALVAFAMTPIIITGGIDLSPAANNALVSIVVAMLLVSGMNVWTAMVIGVMVGTACGLINGLLVGYLKLPPFVATLSTQCIVQGVALTMTGGVPVTNLGSSVYKTLGIGSIGGIVPINFIPVVILFVFTYFLLHKTKFGINTYAIGGNETAALWAGINVKKHKLLVYTFAGFMFGIAGVIAGSRVSSGQPYLSTGIELDAIAAACIGGTSMSGGKGTMIGTLLGVMLMGLLNNALNLSGISTFVQDIVTGFVIAIAVFVSMIRDNKA